MVVTRPSVWTNTARTQGRRKWRRKHCVSKLKMFIRVGGFIHASRPSKLLYISSLSIKSTCVSTILRQQYLDNPKRSSACLSIHNGTQTQTNIYKKKKKSLSVTPNHSSSHLSPPKTNEPNDSHALPFRLLLTQQRQICIPFISYNLHNRRETQITPKNHQPHQEREQTPNSPPLFIPPFHHPKTRTTLPSHK